MVYNPCGLIANSFFNGKLHHLIFPFEIEFAVILFDLHLTFLIDIFVLSAPESTPTSVVLDESDISWSSDDDKFKQPSGFKSVQITNGDTNCTSAANQMPANCKYYQASDGTEYLYYYPDDDTTQYLYESYPQVITPLDGVTNKHFKVWMRPAALSKFRKLYGKIDGDFKKGDQLIFFVTANFEVDSFDGTKSLVITNLGEFGGKNPYLGVAYIVVGSISLLFGTLFALKQMISPRPIADASLLNWN